MKITELKNKVPRGSQKKRHKHPIATDDPEKYIGKWERYETPQGFSSKSAQDQLYSEGFDGYTQRFAPSALTITGDPEHPTDMDEIKKSKKAPKKTVKKSVKAMSGRLTPKITPMGEKFDFNFLESPEDYPPSNLNIDITNDEPVRRRKKPNPRMDIIGKNIKKLSGGKKSNIAEKIRIPQKSEMNMVYEVEHNDEVVGLAKIVDSIIVELKIREDMEFEYDGKVFDSIMGTMVREADRLNSDLLIDLSPVGDTDMKRFMERYGFRETGNGIMVRNAGSVTPPSSPISRGLGGK